ncbi:hypothetical protein Angca_004283 [Angiostrongylus cantonensis]|nr:hypothetical protein Angca_004283 [Angiostrongylus cantonensis]
MDQQLREIEGLLESSTHPKSTDAATRIKKYVKLVLPHVVLVAVVCLYAMIGAYIFYRLESPNEDRLKTVGKALIGDMRNNLISMIRDGRSTEELWRNSIEKELYRFNDKIYRAFKEQYVRYADVHVVPHSERLKLGEVDRLKRHRNTKLRSEKSDKMWTASSALFFAATTMATIGYGNIVPATSSGRIACVVFALFGAPLAIITIGDLGKFLSECTIWLHKEMKKARSLLHGRWRRFRGLNKESIDAESQTTSSPAIDWEDLVMDKTEVPVFMVFTILLLYIAFGGVLFSFLEGWTYMDAFYYSFISLTTIGFGDIVPENHDYIVLMLVYLGVGLAVTTMCIDLVGIQYIQKIHYFGRKFRGTDLLQLLRRKRMIERRLAMGQGDEILQMYIQQMQKQMSEPSMVDQEWEEDKTLNDLEWQIDDALISSRYSYEFPVTVRVPSPNVLSIRSYRLPSNYSSSSASARSLLLKRSHGESLEESGPSVSEHCSLSTEPSVHIRQAYWDNYQSPTASLLSFDYDAAIPSPDYQLIALSARRSRRLHSCPSSLRLTSPLESVSNPQRSVPASGRCHARICSSPTSNPLLHSAPLSFRISEPFMLSKLAAQCESPPPEIASEFEPIPVTQLVAIGGEFQADSSFCYSQCFSPTSMHETLVPRLQLGECSSAPSNASARFHTTLFPIVENRRLSNVSVHKEEDHTKPIMLRKKKQRLAKMKDPLHNVDWLNPIGLSCMESWDSYIRMLEEYNRPHESVVYEKTATPMVASSTATASSPPQLRESVPIPLRPVPQKNAAPHSSPVPTPDLLPPASSPPPLSQSPSFATPPPKDPAPPPHHSPPTVHPSPTRRLPTPVMPPVDTTPYTLPSTSCVSTPPREPSPPRVHLSLRPSTNEPPRFNTPVYMEVEKEVEVVPEKREHVLNYSELQETTSHMDTDSSSEDENAGRSDFDLGAFELVDSGITAETLLSKEEPVIFHKDIPVHSVHHDTVQTETALANLMSAPSSMLTGAIPPTMVEDNYCFVVDGEQVRMGDILGDEQWWRHTSRPTKYFYSEDLRQFYRVNCIAVKGKVIAAKLAGNVQQAAALAASSSSASTPRSSVSGVSARLRDSTVPLTHVYKVIRFYSFWKSCTSFHRIVTMIDRVVGDPHPNPDFKKRLFVQYLWRNAKPIEKARVQKEFDPQRQRLLRYVTNPLTRKRFVEDETSTVAVIVDESTPRKRRPPLRRQSTIEREESEDSTIDFPVQVNATPVKYLSVDEGEDVLYHFGGSIDPIPIFSVDEEPLDGPSTLTNALKCPVKYISKIPPTLVTDNFCFICDGDEVCVDEILAECQWWKQTSSSIRFYYSNNMSTFHQVTLLTCRGETRGAYRRQIGGSGIVKVSPNEVFRVSRFFSSWKTCPSFHRIISVISPITEEGEINYNFKKRIFIQYFWRSKKPCDRALISKEYLDFQNQLAVHRASSLIPSSTSTVSKSSNLLASRNSLREGSSHSQDSTSRAASRFRTIAKSLKRRCQGGSQQNTNTLALPDTGNN